MAVELRVVPAAAAVVVVGLLLRLLRRGAAAASSGVAAVARSDGVLVLLAVVEDDNALLLVDPTASGTQELPLLLPEAALPLLLLLLMLMCRPGHRILEARRRHLVKARLRGERQARELIGVAVRRRLQRRFDVLPRRSPRRFLLDGDEGGAGLKLRLDQPGGVARRRLVEDAVAAARTRWRVMGLLLHAEERCRRRARCRAG